MFDGYAFYYHSFHKRYLDMGPWHTFQFTSVTTASCAPHGRYLPECFCATFLYVFIVAYSIFSCQHNLKYNRITVYPFIIMHG